MAPHCGARAQQTFYLSRAGDDGNSGESMDDAWLTIGALDSAGLNAGDTVVFRDGDTFVGRLTTVSGVTYIRSNTTSMRPAILFFEDHTVEVNPGSVLNGLNVVSYDGFSSVGNVLARSSATICNCEIRSNSNKAVTVSGNNVIVRNNWLTDGFRPASQILTLFDSRDCIIQNNFICKTNPATEIGLFVHGSGSSGHWIDGNIFLSQVDSNTGKKTSAIQLYNDYSAREECFLVRNVIYGRWDRFLLLRNRAFIFDNVINGIESSPDAILLDVRNNSCDFWSNELTGGDHVLALVSVASSADVSISNCRLSLKASHACFSGDGDYWSNKNWYSGTFDQNDFTGLSFAEWQLVSGNDTESTMQSN